MEGERGRRGEITKLQQNTACNGSTDKTVSCLQVPKGWIQGISMVNPRCIQVVQRVVSLSVIHLPLASLNICVKYKCVLDSSKDLHGK